MKEHRLADGVKSCRIFEGCFQEALDVLESEDVKVDAVVADPPYCSGGDVITRRTRRINKYFEYLNKKNEALEFCDSMDQISYFCFIEELLCSCVSLLNKGGYAFIFSDWRQISVNMIAFYTSGLTPRGIIPWNKRNSRPNPGIFNNQCEYILWGTNGPSGDKYASGYIEHSPKPIAKRFHVCEKPVEVIDHLLSILPDSAQTVLDPFAGSCSTAVAAAKKSLNFIGCEVKEAFIKTGLERLTPLYSAVANQEQQLS